MSGQTPVPATLGAGLYSLSDCSMISPLYGNPTFGIAVYGIVASAVATNATGDYSDCGVCTIHAIFNCNGVNPQVIGIGWPYIKGNPLLDAHYCEYGIYHTISGSAFTFPTTHMTAYKIANL